MNNHDIYYSEVPTASDTTLLANIPQIPPIVIGGGGSRAAARIERRVTTEAAHEYGKARLTAEVIRNTTALSAMADAASAAVPSAEIPVRKIVYGYAECSSKRIGIEW